MSCVIIVYFDFAKNYIYTYIYIYLYKYNVHINMFHMNLWDSEWDILAKANYTKIVQLSQTEKLLAYSNKAEWRENILRAIINICTKISAPKFIQQVLQNLKE
jgi:hypothetical protein